MALMKVLVVAPQPFFSPRGTPFSVYYRTLVTSELGHEANILTYGQGADVDIPGVRLIRIPAFRFLGQVKTGPSGLKLFLDVFMALWTVALLLRHRYDVVHAHEEAVFWCRWLKPIFRFRLIYDMHSSLPQQLQNFQFTDIRAIRWIFEKLEISATRASEAVIAICPDLYQYAKSLTTDHEKILLIENSLFDPVRLSAKAIGEYDTSSAHDPRQAEDKHLEHWLQRRQASQTLVYAGTLEAYQGIDKLLEAFAVVVKRIPAAGLLIIGGQPAQVDAFRAMADRLGLAEHVYFTGQRSQTEAQRLVESAGACVSPRFSGNNTPLKIYHLMASGVPLVATRIGSHTQVLTDEIATLTGVSIDELAAGIATVLESPQTALEKARRGQQWYEEHYSRDVYTAKMRKLFEVVV